MEQQKARQAGRRLRQVQALFCRTSPTTMREGRIRSASFTSRRSGASPAPSWLGERVCIATRSGSGTRSSKTSRYVVTHIKTIRGPVFGRRTWQQACP